MAERLTASKLRADVYNVLDRVLRTGVAVEIERKGMVLRIAPADDEPTGRLANLRPHPDALVGDPEDLVHLDWSETWRP